MEEDGNMKGKDCNTKGKGCNTKGKDCNTKGKDPTRKKEPTASKVNSEEILIHEHTIHVKRPVSIHTVPLNSYVNDNQCPLLTKPQVVRLSKSVCVS